MCSRFQGVDAARRLLVFLAICFAILRTGWAADALSPDRSPEPPSRWIVVRLAASLFQPLIEQPIDERLPVDEEILGVHVVGTAHVLGQPRLELVDDAHAAGLTVRLTGTIASQTTGRMGPVTIFGGSQTQFTASKRVVFDPSRGFVGQWAAIDVQTKVSTQRIESRRGGPLGRAIERLAWSRAQASNAEATAIVRERTERRLRAEFDRLLDARLARINRMVNVRHIVELIVASDKGVQYACSTSAAGLQIAAAPAAADPAELPNGQTLPGFADGGLPVQVWVSDSLVHEGAARALRWWEAGRRLLRISGPLHLTPARSDARRLAVDFSSRGEWFVFGLGKDSTSDPLLTANR